MNCIRGILHALWISLLLWLFIGLVAWVAKSADVPLEWNCPSNAVPAEVGSYSVWWATNIIGPWAKITNVVSTNATVQVPVGANFFRVTASNYWGEAQPSNIAWTPEQSGDVEKLRITNK